MLGLTECDDVRRQGFEEMHGVALLQDRRFARCVKCVLSELADRLEQAIARRSASHLRDDQRLGDKRVQRVEHGTRSSGGPSHTSSAAANVNPPANTLRRLSNTLSAGVDS